MAAWGHARGRRDGGARRVRPGPLAQEFLAAAAAMLALLAVVSTLYWLFTGNSPWPTFVVLQGLAFACGIGLLTLVSPRRRD